MNCRDLENCGCAEARTYRGELEAAFKAANPPYVMGEFVQYAVGSTDPLFSMGNGTWLLRSTIQRMIEATGYLNVPEEVDEITEPQGSAEIAEAASPTPYSGKIAENVIDATLAERGRNYGDFSDNALYAQSLKEIVRSGVSWEGTPDYAREAIDLILSKIGRMLSGSPLYVDNWHDIQGYAKLVEERLKKETI